MLTIGITNYNKEKHLVKCLESLITRSNSINNLSGMIDVIIVDDASTDNSRDIIEKYVSYGGGGNRWRLIHNRINKGVADSRNEIIDACQTDYLTFVDGDDWVNISKLFNVYALLDLYSSEAIDLCISNVRQVSYRDGCTKILTPIKKIEKFGPQQCLRFIEDYLTAPNQNGLIAQCFGKIYSLKFLDSYRIRFESGQSNYEDVDFVVRCLGFSPKGLVVNESFYSYMNYKLGATESYSSKRPILSHLGYLKSVHSAQKAWLDLVDSTRVTTDQEKEKYIFELGSNAIAVLTSINIVCHASKVKTFKTFFVYWKEVSAIIQLDPIQQAFMNYNVKSSPGADRLSGIMCICLRAKLGLFVSIIALVKLWVRYGFRGDNR